MDLRLRTHDRVQLRTVELSIDPTEIENIPWIRAGVARLRATRLGYELEIGPYAGTLVLGSTVLNVGELVPGTVAACLDLSETGRRTGQQPSGPGRPVDPGAAVAHAFTNALHAAIQFGVRKEYVAVRTSTSRPRGKVLVGPTLRGPWARGNTREVVVRYRPLTEDNSTNRVLLAAGLRAQHLLDSDDPALRQLRTCLVALSGAKVVGYPEFPGPSVNLDAETVEAIALARTLLDGIPVLPDTDTGGAEGAFSAWINVERVFEEAMVTICRRLRPGKTHSGKSLAVEIFHSRETDPSYRPKRADPDIVIKTSGRTLVLDAKYRRSGDQPSDDELYQLIAHAQAFNADAAALITPALRGSPRISWLGRLRSGCPIEVVAVDPRDGTGTQALIEAWLASRT